MLKIHRCRPYRTSKYIFMTQFARRQPKCTVYNVYVPGWTATVIIVAVHTFTTARFFLPNRHSENNIKFKIPLRIIILALHALLLFRKPLLICTMFLRLLLVYNSFHYICICKITDYYRYCDNFNIIFLYCYTLQLFENYDNYRSLIYLCSYRSM